MSFKDTIKLNIRNQQFSLLPQKALFWADNEYLILSDLHLGKTGHFRKSGIAAPGSANLKNLDRLSKLIDSTEPEKLFVLGDLFHSSANREWFQFEKWRQIYPDLNILLVSGNHDQLHDSFYQSANIDVTNRYVFDDFLFVHDSADMKEEISRTIVSGHIHPGVKLKGKGRQKLRLPCFSVSDREIVLPAFGEFTGLHLIQPGRHRQIFPIVENRVISLESTTE